MVKSSAAVVPPAASVMSPPPAFVTAEFTVSGPLVRIAMSSPAAPPVMLTPVVVIELVVIVAMVRPPAVSCRRMSPVTVVAARLTALISISPTLPMPMPATIRKS